ncbi:MAG: hypothetical protein WC587_01730 [Candidatus Paceibacterota bacterium]
MDDNKTLSNAELELTQKIQMHFPRGIISLDVLKAWNSSKKELITARLIETFGKRPGKNSFEFEKDPILTLIATVKVPARTGRFVAKVHFIVDTGKKAKVKISYLGDNFREHFLGKTEEPTSETTLCQHELKKPSRDIPIISELGGENKAETTLSAMFGLMEMQPNGETGTLLTNGYANIFYVRDLGGVLWTVRCLWSGVGWLVGASSVDSPRDWDAGDRVFSCNS